MTKKGKSAAEKKGKMAINPDYLEKLNTSVNIFDFRTERMVYANRKFMQWSGLTAEECLQLTLTEYNKYIHDSDLHLLINDVRRRMEQLYPKFVHDDECQLVFDINFRMKDKNNEYRSVLAQCAVIEWNEKLFPVAILNLHTDITDHKKDIKMVLVVHVFNEHKKQWEEVHKEEFLRQPACLSKRQSEIMQLMVKGNSLEMIADLLNISYNTVRKHCQNTLDETGCESQEALKEMAVKEGWA